MSQDFSKPSSRVGKFSTVPATLADGSIVHLAVDDLGRVKVVAGSPKLENLLEEILNEMRGLREDVLNITG